MRAALGSAFGVDADDSRTSSTSSARSALRAALPDLERLGTLSRTLRRGFSDEIGSWKIIWIFGAGLADLLVATAS